jgi:hypothetical protein
MPAREQPFSADPYDGTRLLVELHDGTKVVASRTGTRELKELME